MPFKVSRSQITEGVRRKDRPKKRKQSFNPKNPEIDDNSFTSSSAKKLKGEDKQHVPEEATLQYSIIDFALVFSTLSSCVRCSNIIKSAGEEQFCNGKIDFKQCSIFGLGFKLVVQCERCKPKYILSCQQIGRMYELNRRFIFVMRVLGLGLAGCKKFCGLMDISSSFLNQSTYDFYINKIHECITIVAEKLFSSAATEEKQMTSLTNNIEDTTDVTVSGDGTWKKRGFASLYGVSSLIGYQTGKVLDVIVKSSYCKLCESWKKKLDTAEFEEWKEEHIETDQCAANHTGASGNMEVSSIIEMFKRSIVKHGVRYVNYIGDGDSKTYSGILKAQPYGEDFVVNKKECIGHVQKRMGTRLRDLVKKTVEEKMVKGKKTQKKILSGKGKLTSKLIDKLTVYYGLAIRRNSDSADKMRDAIWATYYHYSSTDKNPQHQNCPEAPATWCTWQQASASNNLSSFKHNYTPLPDDVLTAMKPIYEDLSKDELLERCVGGFTQNNNESFNQLIWKITPKILPAGSIIVQIAALIVACTFNEGISALLLIMHSMDLKLGPNSHNYARKIDENRVIAAEKKSTSETREARVRHRQEQKDALDIAAAAGSLLYGPGIDDSM
ncbi:uncharacterized protein LOC135167084 isoform X2 [Diachasmimorpha longicaudata]|uniref:uncharacterized protein LOC135167084 isoform X2 n=1 Tax=Diachasmimorpha longicaudata TaxID=58733 RepID=UPI0030B888C0